MVVMAWVILARPGAERGDGVPVPVAARAEAPRVVEEEEVPAVTEEVVATEPALEDSAGGDVAVAANSEAAPVAPAPKQVRSEPPTAVQENAVEETGGADTGFGGFAFVDVEDLPEKFCREFEVVRCIHPDGLREPVFSADPTYQALAVPVVKCEEEAGADGFLQSDS